MDVIGLEGDRMHVVDEQVLRVAPLDGKACALTGIAPDPVPVAEAAAHLVARLVVTRPLLRLSRPDGSPVWLKPEAVSLVRAPQPNDIPPGESVGAVVMLQTIRQAVQESVSDVQAALDRNFPDTMS